MKIGILTFWKTEDNYGQLLQCFATQAFLRSLGHETFLIKATTGKEYNPNFKEKLISKLRTAYRLLPYPCYLVKRGLTSAFYTLTHGRLKPNVTSRGFEEFRKTHLHCTEKEYTLAMLENNPPKADAYLVGSDQIWNTTDGIYFLKWAPDNAVKASIAASFGARVASDDFCRLIEPWLRRFNLVTVREKSGLEICKAAEVEKPHLVPDPTLLLSADDYEDIVSDKAPSQPYIFIYFLGTRTQINWKEIHRFAKSKNLKIIYVGSQGQEDKYPKAEPTIPEWLGLMKNATYVITNSFHGTVFAIQFRKKFLVYPVCGVAAKMNDRLTTLLSPLHLDYRIYTDNINIIEKDINYTSVHNQLQNQANTAKELIASAFQ